MDPNATGASEYALPLAKPTAKPRVKVLIPVWGEKYISRFAQLSLAALMAEGNLPALVEHCDVELIFLTGKSDSTFFENLEAIKIIGNLCPIRYVPIDDLIVTGLYSVTLTLAYTRGMAMFGDDMLNMHFLYLNADFVVGDGSLKNLAHWIHEGRNIILAGSVRVVSEDVEPHLIRMKSSDGVLRARPRDLAQFLFDYPHIMQVAKTVNQDLCWARSPNHLFWNVDDSTVVARFYQIFMFCLRPTVVRGTIDGYCDYSFVPAFCPGEPIFVVGNSDEVCLLEMQGRSQEANDVIFAPGREENWIASVDEWCTREHALIVRKPIIYHSKGIGRHVQAAINGSETYIDWQLSQIRDPASYEGHYYWVYGVAAWRLHRGDNNEIQGWPKELDLNLPVRFLKHPSFDYDRGRRIRSPAKTGSLRAQLRAKLFGSGLHLTRLHPDVGAYGPLLRRAAEAQVRLRSDERYRILVVAELGTWIDEVFSHREGHVFRIEPLVAATWQFLPDPAVDEVVILSTGQSAAELERIIRNTHFALRSGGRMTVLVHHTVDWNVGAEVVTDHLRAFAIAPLSDIKVERFEIPEKHRIYGQAVMLAQSEIANGRFWTKVQGAFRLGFAILRRLSKIGPKTPMHPAAQTFTGRRPATAPR